MYRLMQPSDEAAVVALWQKERGDSAEFIKTALEKFAGAENIYVAEENDEIVAAALAVPVTLKGRSGSYLYGLCGQGSLLLAQFLFPITLDLCVDLVDCRGILIGIGRINQV